MAASVFCCLRCCRDGGTGHIPLKEMPAVQLDTQHMGTSYMSHQKENYRHMLVIFMWTTHSVDAGLDSQAVLLF